MGMPPRPPAHGARSMRVSKKADALKASLVVIMLLLVAWNASIYARFSDRTPLETADSHGDRKPQQLRISSATSTAPMAAAKAEKALTVPTVKPWFLEPDAYRKEDGCDFSSAVAAFDPSKLEIHCGNIGKLQHGEFLGQGFWRQVFRAQWKGKSVAVKVIKDKLRDRSDILPRHVEEAAAMFPIRDEPNIVSLVGWCNSTVVVEYVPQKLDELVFDRSNALSVQRSLELARDAARGLAQLHGAGGGPFAHTDIQTRQFLVDDNGRLKLNDFNRIKYVGPGLLAGQERHKCKSPVSIAKGKWRAPEEYLQLDIDEKADIYSLSLVLWSLRARDRPFGDLEKPDVYVQVPEGKRPDLLAMADYPEAMQQLIQRCWQHDPQRRPTAREVATEIDRILKRFVAEQLKR